MEKQNLHPFAKFAAMSLVALPLFGLNQVNAQAPPVPTVFKTYKSAPLTNRGENTPLPAYSYLNGTSKPLQPAQVRAGSSVVPPIITGRQLAPKKPRSVNTPQAPVLRNPLQPIGSGIQQTNQSGIQQVKATAGPSKITPAFSPAKMPIRAQGSGTRGFAAPAPAAPVPAAPATPAVQIPLPSSVLSSQNVAAESFPSAPVISGSLVGSNELPADYGASPVISPNYFEATPTYDVPIDSVVDGGGCASGNCGNCSSCNSCGDGSVNPNQVNCDYGTYGSVSSARRYAFLDFLYLTRDDGNITNSNFNPLGDFDFSPGWRFTIGSRPDMTQGRELSYFGTAGIDETSSFTDSQNRLDPLFSAAGGIVTTDLSAFFDANQHIQSKETNLHSIEINRVRWGWDVLKSFVGFRYVYLDDEYQLESTAFERDAFGGFLPTTEQGRYRIETVNHLLGAQIGAELFYDIGYRFSLSGVSKYGLYANINKVDNFLQNDESVLLDTEDNSATISSTWEINLLAHYQIRQTARLRFGYTGLYLSDVATVSDNFSAFVSPFTGFEGSDSDDAFIHGFNFGLEIFR